MHNILTKPSGFKITAEVKRVKKRLTFFTVFALLFLLALPSFSLYKLNKSIPSQISLTDDKRLEINLGTFVSASAQADYCFSEKGRLFISCPENESYSVSLRLFGLIPVKHVTVSAAAEGVYMPSGQAIGIKLYTDGVLVVGLSENLPAYAAGIKTGDIITHIDGVRVLNAVHFSSLINKSGEKQTTISFIRGNDKCEVSITPVFSEGEYKIGAWIRDSSAGIGTLTYVNASDSGFGALGHGICDSDTGKLLTVMQGRITGCNIIDTVKGQKGSAGRLCGVLQTADTGSIYKNCAIGIYGSVDKEAVYTAKPVPAASRFEVHEGEATILATVDENGPEEYSVLIEKINTSDNSGASMVIKITDEKLIEKTGGIVQGMSGAPILQDGKIVGAVTHVFVSDPTRGYGIFIELMLNQNSN